MNHATPPGSENNDPWLDDLLRATPPSVRPASSDADAFTARVMEALPPPTAQVIRREQRQRRLVIGLGAAFGCALALVAGGSSLPSSLSELASLLSLATDPLGPAYPATIATLAAFSGVVALVLVSGGSVRRLF